MPADLVPRSDVPDLASRVDSPAMFRVLSYLQQAGFLMNGPDIDGPLAEILLRLTDLGLVDAAYTGEATGKPYLWTGNGNGSRVLKHIEKTPPLRELIADKFHLNDRARTALASLPDREQMQTLVAIDLLAGRAPESWLGAQRLKADGEGAVYLVPTTSELRAFLRVYDGHEIELFDLVREETLRLFLERQGAGSATG